MRGKRSGADEQQKLELAYQLPDGPAVSSVCSGMTRGDWDDRCRLELRATGGSSVRFVADDVRLPVRLEEVALRREFEIGRAHV